MVRRSLCHHSCLFSCLVSLYDGCRSQLPCFFQDPYFNIDCCVKLAVLLIYKRIIHFKILILNKSALFFKMFFGGAS